jgi:hypothetical protein
MEEISEITAIKRTIETIIQEAVISINAETTTDR